jgi:hypothetical protein
MVAWVVINRQQPRQFVPFLAVRPSFPILEPSLLALFHSLDALCFKSVHQPFSIQPLPHSFIKMPGCMGFLPCDMRFNVQTCERSNVFPTYPPSFHTLAHSFVLNENSTPLFSDVSELFAKNHPGWGTPGLAHSQGLLEPHGPDSRILELADRPALGRKHGRQMGRDYS